MSHNTLLFYSTHARELVGKTDAKIRAILAQGCIEYVREEGNNHFICKPIMNQDGTPYNKTTYEIKSHKVWGWTCTCQGFQSKMKKHMEDPINNSAPSCSHTIAMWEFIKRWNINRKQEKIYGGMQMTFGVD
jgi:hypothetical protein